MLTQVRLADSTSLQLGGPARYLVRARDEATLTQSIGWAAAQDCPIFTLGAGSNVVISDDGFEGLVILMALGGFVVERTSQQVRVTVGAGVALDTLVRWSVLNGLSGAECLAGIPGTCGAAPVQNVGAYGQEIGALIERVRAIDTRSLETVEVSREQCRFSHRDSAFKHNPSLVIASVTFRFETGFRARIAHAEVCRELGGALAEPANVYTAVLAIRRRKSMVLDPSDPNRRSVGSFFISPPVSAEAAEGIVEESLRLGFVRSRKDIPMYELPDGRHRFAGGWLVERVGFRKGERRGSVGISTRHALSLVHLGAGSTAELLAFAREIQTRVRDSLGVHLEPEPTYVGV